MTKSELVAKLAVQNPNLYLRDIETLVDTVIEEMSAALERGDRIELRGFGAFSVKERASHEQDEIQERANRLMLLPNVCLRSRRANSFVTA